MVVGKGLIKEESLIKITPLAGGIYAGKLESGSCPQQTFTRSQSGMDTFKNRKDLLKNFDNYQYLLHGRYRFVTEVLCFTDIGKRNLHSRLISASLRLTGELIIMLQYKIYFKLH